MCQSDVSGNSINQTNQVLAMKTKSTITMILIFSMCNIIIKVCLQTKIVHDQFRIIISILLIQRKIIQFALKLKPSYFNNKMQKSQNISPTYMQMPHQFAKVKKIVLAQVYTTQFIIAFDKENLYVSPIVSISQNNFSNASFNETIKGQSKSPINTDKLPNQQNNLFLQIFAIPNIKQIQVIAKNFVLITTQANYIGLFNITVCKKQPVPQTQTSPNIKTQNQISTTLTTPTILNQKIQFQVVMQWFLHKSYFIRQVIDNVFQVQIFVNDNQLIIYQFTTKNKTGRMYFNMNANGKIKNSEKNQIYGSKSFINLNRKALYTLKNFADKSFIITPILINGIVKVGSSKNVSVYNQNTQQNSLIGFFGLKDEEYFSVYSNMSVISCSNPLINHKIVQKDTDLNTINFKYNQKYSKLQIQKNPYSQAVKISQNSQEVVRYSQFLEYLMIQDNQSGKLSVYQIRQKNSRIVNCEFWSNEQNWRWHIGWGKRLIGLHVNKKIIKFIKIGNELKIKDQQSKLPQIIDSSEEIKYKQLSQNKNEREQNINKTYEAVQKTQNKSVQEVKKLSQKVIVRNQQKKMPVSQSNGNQKNLQINNQPKISSKQQQSSLKKAISIQKGQQNEKKQVKQQKKQQLKADNSQTVQKQEQNLGANKFKPMKIIQRNKTSVSKTLQKSKQIAPLQSQVKKQQKQEVKIQSLDVSKKQKADNKKNEQKQKQKQKIQQPVNKTDKKDGKNLQSQKKTIDHQKPMQRQKQISQNINMNLKQKEKQEQRSESKNKNVNNFKTISFNQTQNIKSNHPVVKNYVQMLSEDSDFTQEQTEQIEIQIETNKPTQNKVQKNTQNKDQKTIISKQQTKNDKSYTQKIETQNRRIINQKNISANLNQNHKQFSESQKEEQEQIQNKLVTSLLDQESDNDEKQKVKRNNQNINNQKDKIGIKNSGNKLDNSQDRKLVFSTTINRNKIFGNQSEPQQKKSAQNKKNNVQEKCLINSINQEKYSIVTDQALDKIFKVKSAGESDFLISNIFSNKSSKQRYVQQGPKSQNMKFSSGIKKQNNQNPFKFNSFNLFNKKNQATSPDVPKLNMPIPTTNIFTKSSIQTTNLFSKDYITPSNNIFFKNANTIKNQENKQIQKVQQKASPLKQKKIQTVQNQRKKQVKPQKSSQDLTNFKINKKIQQIQAYVQKFQVNLIKCIQESQKNVLKKVQQLPHTHNPYSKSSSLVIPNQIKDELVGQLKVQVKKWMMQQMFKKIQVSFKQLMQDHKGVYDQALEYYAGQAKKKIASLQLQFQQQNTMLNQMQLISNNMKASLQNIILQGEQMHTFQLKQFKKQIAMSTQSLELVSNYINNPKLLKQKQQRIKKYENTLSQLKELKELLLEKQKKKQQRRLKKQQQKLQLQNERAQKQRIKLKKQKKMIEQRMSKDSQKQKKKTSKSKLQRKEQKQKKKLNRTLHI